MHMIECSHINVSYGSKVILQDIDLNIADGEFLCLLGQSGCGKSTFLTAGRAGTADVGKNPDRRRDRQRS